MIAFRLDANEQIATGHMFRCMAVARQCQKLGKECIFFLAEGGYTEPLERNGFRYRELPLKWDDWNFGTEILKGQILELSIECMVVDSYRVTEGFFEAVTEWVPTFYFDDFCDKKYHVSAVLHYSEWDGEPLVSKLYRGTDVKVYRGMQYVPLREGFSPKKRGKQEKYDLLITTGGSDTYHVTGKLLEKMIDREEFCGLSVCVVLGKMNTDKEKIEKMCAGRKNISVMQNVSNMDEIMKESRFAVTAGGNTVNELMASGTLFVCFSFSDDQTRFCERLDAHGHGVFAGDVRENTEETLEKILNEIRRNRMRKEEEYNRAALWNQSFIDGAGSVRIAGVLLELCEKYGRE